MGFVDLDQNEHTRSQCLSRIALTLNWTDAQTERGRITKFTRQPSNHGSTLDAAEQAARNSQHWLPEDYTFSGETAEGHDDVETPKANLSKTVKQARCCFNCQEFCLQCDGDETGSRCSACRELKIQCCSQDEAVGFASGVAQPSVLAKKKDEKDVIQVVLAYFLNLTVPL